MRFHFGPIPASPDFLPDDSWKMLKEPSVWLLQLIALPIGILTALCVLFFWSKIVSADFGIAPSIPTFVLTIIGTIVVHELVHAIAHPGMGWASHSVLGFWPAKLIAYAHYHGELTRNRFIAILLMPLVILSFLPIIMTSFTHATYDWIVISSVFNAFSACVDMLGAGMIFYQIPATAIVRNQEWKTYWRERIRADI